MDYQLKGIDKVTWWVFKSICDRQGKTIKEVLIELIEEYIKKKEG